MLCGMSFITMEYSFILLTTFWFILCDAIKGGDLQTQLRIAKLNSGFYTGPYLDGHIITNITTQTGTHAFLPCKFGIDNTTISMNSMVDDCLINNSQAENTPSTSRSGNKTPQIRPSPSHLVKQLGNKSVSWIRVRDGHILTVDRTTFIADDRFQAFYVDHTGLWTLQIKYVQGRDAGLYECQVASEPKISARVDLQVVIPRTELIGESDRYVKSGSTVVLRCVVRGALEPPSYIIWSQGTMQLSSENRMGWQVTIERANFDPEIDPHSTIGSLIIKSAKEKDSGNYTCNPSNSPPVTITLHVLNAQPAEIIGDPDPYTKAVSGCPNLNHIKIYNFIIIILITYFFNLLINFNNL